MPELVGTSLTPGFTELLANWDSVLQSLDRVSAYTAERANEPLSARLGSFRAARPTLFGESPEGSEWQSLKGGGYPTTEVVTVKEAADSLVIQGAGCERHQRFPLQKLEQRFAQEEVRSLLDLAFHRWALLIHVQAKEDATSVHRQQSREDQNRLLEVENALKTEKDKVQRLQAVRGRYAEVLRKSCLEAQRKETLNTVFQVWHLEIRRRTEELQKQQLSQRTLEVAQVTEEVRQLRVELEAAKGEKVEALDMAQQELHRLTLELGKSQVTPSAPIRVDATKDSERTRQLTELSIKLARSEADHAEAKSQVDPLRSQVITARRQLEMTYVLLNPKEAPDPRTGSRDRDLAVTHLWQVLERLRDVPQNSVEKLEKIHGSGEGESPSAMSTPNIQSSLSLPSLSSASGTPCTTRSRSKGKWVPATPW